MSIEMVKWAIVTAASSICDVTGENVYAYAEDWLNRHPKDRVFFNTHSLALAICDNIEECDNAKTI